MTKKAADLSLMRTQFAGLLTLSCIIELNNGDLEK